MKLVLLASALLATAAFCLADDAPQALHPVLIVPGILGNQLQVRLNRTQTVRPYCHKKSNWYTIWFDPSQLLPGVVNCWVDNLRLDFDEETGKPVNPAGVESRVPGFGGTETVEYMNPIRFVFGYMDKLVHALVGAGYRRGSSIRAAPYDFRLAPNDNPAFLKDLKDLTEQMYTDSGNKSVILLSHSVGSRVLYYFLSLQSEEWKSKYLSRWITIAGSVGGDAVVLATLSAGIYDGRQGVSRNSVRTLFRSFSQFAFESPDPLVFGERTIFQVKDTRFTAAQLPAVFQAINHTAGVRQLQGTRPLIKNLDAPGVKVSCLFGSGIPTIEKIVYDKETSHLDDARLIRGDGDGNVNLVSSSACKRWSGTHGFEAQQFSGIKHLDLIRDPRVLTKLVDIVARVNRDEQ